MKKRSLLAFLLPLFAHLVGMPRDARADDVDPGHVEACTLEKQARPGEECVLCRAYYRSPEHCPATLVGYGVTQRCRSAGTSTWREVWCRTAGNSSARPITDELRSRLLDPAGREAVDAGTADVPAPAKGAGAGLAADDAAASATAPEPTARRAGSCGACDLAPTMPTSPALAALATLLMLGARRGATRCSRGRPVRR